MAPDPGCADLLHDLLTQRELIEPADGGYRFQVELIRHWFVQRQGFEFQIKFK